MSAPEVIEAPVAPGHAPKLAAINLAGNRKIPADTASMEVLVAEPPAVADVEVTDKVRGFAASLPLRQTWPRR